MKLSQHFSKPLRIPVGIENGDRFFDLSNFPIIAEIVGIKYNAKFCLCLLLVSDIIQAHDFDFSAAALQHIQNELDCSCFAGAVWPDQPHNISFGERESNIAKLKMVKGFRQIFYLQIISHLYSPPIKYLKDDAALP